MLSDALRQGAMPGKRPAEAIEAALRALRSGETLFVDAAGQLHYGKEPFLAGTAQPLASFRKASSGDEIIVNEGLPPRNPTYCRSSVARLSDALGDKSRSGEAVPLQYSTVLKSGDRLSLGGDCEITIPRFVPAKPRTAEEQLAQLIASAGAGETLELGRRAVPCCPHTVSRVHCTVQVLKNELGEDGASDIVVKVFPGMPGKSPITIAHGDGSVEEVRGERQVAPGTKILLGHTVGPVTLPYEEGSMQELSQDIVSSIIAGRSERAREALQSYIGPNLGEFSDGVQGKDRIDLPNQELLLKINVLQSQIVEGLRLIKEGQVAEATALFRDDTALKALGYRFEENNAFGLSRLTPQAVAENIEKIAARSWFLVGEKVVYPSAGMLKPGLEPQNDEEAKLLATWHKEIALIWAEEYTHALQSALGSKMVSRKAALLPFADNEADVALFFHEHGVKLTSAFVKERYSQREKALHLAGGFQTPETQQLFSEALASLPIGGRLYVGRDAARHARGGSDAAAFSLPRPRPEEAEPGRHLPLTGVKAHKDMNSVEAIIVRNADGSYSVEPFEASFSLVFVPDSAGYHHRLEAPERVEPGTPIYVGRAFRLVL